MEDYLSRFIRSFFEDHLVCKRNMSIRTIHAYRDAVKLFIQFLCTQKRTAAVNLRVRKIAEADVLAFLKHLEKDRGNAIQTRNHRLTILRQLFGFIAMEEPHLMENCRRITALPSKRGAILPEIQYLEKHEIKAIVESPDDRTVSGRRDHALLLFMYNTGARAQENRGLAGIVALVQPPPKCRSSARAISSGPVRFGM